jgi:isoleucyl-tRNA synthetase
MPINLKDTLNLPQTAFPMKADLVAREPIRVRHWDGISLYKQVRERRVGAPTFILHDGPPFANGEIHLGHVLNKVLKDMVVRYKTMRGFDAPYVTGWDCHGLPIEHAVTKELRSQSSASDPVTVRNECEAFARKYIGIQLEQFRRLGILTDWDQHYLTMEARYEANILRTFSDFVARGLVYRSKKPVYWSIPCRTALAEAEIEYQEHTSSSIWVAFETLNPSDHALPAGTKVVIWTTTPWTIPANLAIALHPRFDYVLVNRQGCDYLVAKELAQTFIGDCNWKDEASAGSTVWKGEALEGLRTQHPFVNRESPVVMAEYVTAETGTGCVHTAPGHGLEDYQTGLKYGLPVYCPVNDDGQYDDDGQIPPELVGKSVLEEDGKNPANIAVLTLLKQRGALLQHVRFKHQYPHCWRSKSPVIFRAMDQFFMRLDQDDLRERVLDQIEQVNWVPDWGKNRIRGAVESRPDWCISRQRAWGVPIPVFFNDQGLPLLDAAVIRALADKVAQHGTNIWFAWDEQQLLEGITLPEGWHASELRKGTDTLDVWFDSGSSHRAVLKEFAGLSFPADLYLEGSDQHRGWFQSSIWTSVVSHGVAPYRTVLTHGFVVDEDGRKFSKSKGSKTATQWVDEFGADVLRLLIASEDYRGDLPIGGNVIKQASGIYRLIRNTLRFQLGNLYDFEASRDAVPSDQLHLLDRWILQETKHLVQKVTEAYDQYDFPKVYQLIQLFCNNTLSATYHDIIKDRLYTLAPADPKRRSSQTALHFILDKLLRLLSPILPFTCDEALAYGLKDGDFAEGAASILLDWPELNFPWDFSSEAATVNRLLTFKSEHINEKLESLRAAKEIGQSLEAEVTIVAPQTDGLHALMQTHLDVLPEIFIVSSVKVTQGDLQVEASHAPGVRCPRSWRWVDALHDTEHWGPVSLRDKQVHDILFRAE